MVSPEDIRIPRGMYTHEELVRRLSNTGIADDLSVKLHRDGTPEELGGMTSLDSLDRFLEGHSKALFFVVSGTGFYAEFLYRRDSGQRVYTCINNGNGSA